MTIADNYVATAADITALTHELFKAHQIDVGSRQTYLRALVATTQAELGRPRLRAGKPVKLDDAAVVAQIAALTTVHDRFYVAVLAALKEDVPGGRAQAVEINRRSNFARTSLSAARGYIRAGHDITAVNVSKLTKRDLAVEAPRRSPSISRLKSRAERQSKTVMATLLALTEVDQQAGVMELELLAGQIATQLTNLGMTAVRNPVKSAATGAPLKIGGRLFIPTETQVLRQQARPS